MNAAPNLLVVGASARAAAWSARRAGFRPCAIDLFGDVDLQALGPTRTIDPATYPAGFQAAVRELPRVPWLYTGALENHPRVVQALQRRRRRLWGNDAKVLETARCPYSLAFALKERGLPAPTTMPLQFVGFSRKAAEKDGPRWLCKPLAGAGGMGIGFWPETPWSRERFLQEYIEGEAHAAVYVAGLPEGTVLLGITRQIIGADWCGSSGFRYCGSIGPVALSEPAADTVATIGTVLAERFGLRGLFGVDFVLKDEVPYPVELNPRTTASVEILERGLGVAALALHARVFLPTETPAPEPVVEKPGAHPSRCWGKAVLFARADLTFPAAGPWQESLTEAADTPPFADIPAPGVVIGSGRPVLTVFGSGVDEASCLANLHQRARETEGWLYRGG